MKKFDTAITGMANRTRFTTQRRLVNFTMNSKMNIFANSDAWEFQENGNIIAVPLDNSYKEMARKGKSFAELFVAYTKEQEDYDDYKKYLPVDIPTVAKTSHISEPTCSVKGGCRLSDKQAEQRSHKKHSGAFRRSMASRKHSQAKKQPRVTYTHRSELPDGEMFVYMCPSEPLPEVSESNNKSVEKCESNELIQDLEEEREYAEFLQEMEDERNFWEMYDMRFAAQFGWNF